MPPKLPVCFVPRTVALESWLEATPAAAVGCGSLLHSLLCPDFDRFVPGIQHLASKFTQPAPGIASSPLVAPQLSLAQRLTPLKLSLLLLTSTPPIYSVPCSHVSMLVCESIFRRPGCRCAPDRTGRTKQRRLAHEDTGCPGYRQIAFLWRPSSTLSSHPEHLHTRTSCYLRPTQNHVGVHRSWRPKIRRTSGRRRSRLGAVISASPNRKYTPLSDSRPQFR